MRTCEVATSLQSQEPAIRDDMTKALHVQRNLLGFFLAAAVLPACAVTGEGDAECVGEKCDGTGGGTCSDKRYGNGTCDTDLSCAVPDIDCFTVFPDDEAAAVWYGKFEAAAAMESGSQPRAILPTTHPQFAKVRALLDRGWEAFRENRPVGLLANKRPGLVFVQDDSINAFVAPDVTLDRAGLAVMVHTGLLDMQGATDDAMLGLMMHELQHAVGLHVLPVVKERTRRYYAAPEDKEPIGREMEDDPKVREAATPWFSAANEIGAYSYAELGGMPFSGDLFRILRTVLESGLQTNEAACTSSRDAINAISTDLAAKSDALSGAIAVDATFKPRIDAAFDQLKSQCLSSFTMSFVDVVASIAGVTPEAFEASLSAEDKALVTGKHVVDAIRLLGEDRRAKMREIEAKFTRDTGRPWSALRYFSTEEDADNTSVPVLRGASLKPTGLGDFLGAFLGATEAACRQVIASGKAPPYGANLTDDHHGTCWRIYNIEAYAKHTEKRARPSESRPLSTAPVPTRLLPPRLRDVVAY